MRIGIRLTKYKKEYPNAIHQLIETEDGYKDLEAEKEIKFIHDLGNLNENTIEEIQEKYANAIHQLKETEDGHKDLEAEKEIKFIHE